MGSLGKQYFHHSIFEVSHKVEVYLLILGIQISFFKSLKTNLNEQTKQKQAHRCRDFDGCQMGGKLEEGMKKGMANCQL